MARCCCCCCLWTTTDARFVYVFAAVCCTPEGPLERASHRQLLLPLMLILWLTRPVVHWVVYKQAKGIAGPASCGAQIPADDALDHHDNHASISTDFKFKSDRRCACIGTHISMVIWLSWKTGKVNRNERRLAGRLAARTSSTTNSIAGWPARSLLANQILAATCLLNRL